VKTMLITGATGTVGGELVARFYDRFEIHAHGRDAQKLLKLRSRYPSLHLVLGDLRSSRVCEALRASAVVIHAAAQKYVDLAERHCAATLETNVLCTHLLADLACRCGVEQFVLISTDKSSSPAHVYGMSKYLAERLVLELSEGGWGTKFTVCRFGNVFGSNGSVVRLWQDALRRPGGKIRVTDPAMTRFMFTVEEAGDLVEYALAEAGNGDVIIPKMRAVQLSDLMALFDGAEVQIVGLRPGEKMHETLYIRGEVSTGYETERYYVLNRKATGKLDLGDIDSSQVERVDPAVLRQWYGSLQARLAA
jgi:UDP-N-acetylglucosamine 4,6-dehydratase/5-epimerase